MLESPHRGGLTIATCKDCLHIDVCEIRTCYMCDGFACDDCEIHSNYGKTPSIKNCKYFKDRNRFVELPCKVGDTVYVIDDMGDEEYLVASCTISAIRYECKETDSKIIIMTEGFLAPFTNSWVLGKTVFLTRKEAERVLKRSVKQSERRNL